MQVVKKEPRLKILQVKQDRHEIFFVHMAIPSFLDVSIFSLRTAALPVFLDMSIFQLKIDPDRSDVFGLGR